MREPNLALLLLGVGFVVWATWNLWRAWRTGAIGSPRHFFRFDRVQEPVFFWIYTGVWVLILAIGAQLAIWNVADYLRDL